MKTHRPTNPKKHENTVKHDRKLFTNHTILPKAVWTITWGIIPFFQEFSMAITQTSNER